MRLHAGMSALDIAALHDNVDELRILLGNGGEANPKHHDNWDWETALHHVAQPSGLVSVNGNAIRVLLKAGADIEAKTRGLARTPLHVSACSRPSARGTIRALLEGGAAVNAEGTDWCTPCTSLAPNPVYLRWRFFCDGEQTRSSSTTRGRRRQTT
ncbi:unnamed protein product [Ectocarpus sp. 12 AP-2014]